MIAASVTSAPSSTAIASTMKPWPQSVKNLFHRLRKKDGLPAVSDAVMMTMVPEFKQRLRRVGQELQKLREERDDLTPCPEDHRWKVRPNMRDAFAVPQSGISALRRRDRTHQTTLRNSWTKGARWSLRSYDRSDPRRSPASPRQLARSLKPRRPSELLLERRPCAVLLTD